MIEFGTRIGDVVYIERPSAYAIISGASKLIALVKTRKGILLPGGGAHPGEDLENALRREVIEELGYELEILDQAGMAAQYQFDRKHCVHYKKIGHFFRANLTQKVGEPVEKDHELVWRSPEESVRSLKWEFQAWAVRQAFRIA